MKVYISGISGTAMGALALFVKKTGAQVCGSDKNEGAVSPELKKAKIDFEIGEQDGEFLRKKFNEGEVEWFVYTSALPKNHPELLLAQKLGIKVSKRDELIDFLCHELGLKMVAVAGTHGKTTTTAMIIWSCLKLGLPIAWLEGTTLGFAPAGEYQKSAKYLIYEADEYDRNFLAFHPWLAVITNVDYDHPDIYPTRDDYERAFLQFEKQSENIVRDVEVDNNLTLAGEVKRKDGSLALEAVAKIIEAEKKTAQRSELVRILNEFPGAGRRFEKIAKNIYSDYAHHPEEIKATINIAKEEAARVGARGIVAIYEPHQNSRQHEIFNQYQDCFLGAEKIFWLPTFLTRENPKLKILTPEDLIQNLTNREKAEAAILNDELAQKIEELKGQNYLVLLMTAGPADAWLRKLFSENI